MQHATSGTKNNVALLITVGLASMLVLVSILNFSQTVGSSASVANLSNELRPTPAFTKVSAPEFAEPGSDPQNVNENEGNDAMDTSSTILLNSSYTAKFNDYWDIYRVIIPSRGTLAARIIGYEAANGELQFGIYDREHQTFLTNTVSPPFSVSTPILPGSYYIAIRTSGPYPHSTNTYTLTNTFVSAPSPTNTLTPSPTRTPTLPMPSASTPTRTPTPALISVSCTGGSTTPSSMVGPGQLITYNATATYTNGWTPKVKYQVLHNGGLIPTPGDSLNCGTGTGMPCSFLPSTVVNDNVFITVNLQKTLSTVVYTCDWNGGWTPSVPAGYGSCTNTCERVLPVTANAPTSTPEPR